MSELKCADCGELIEEDNDYEELEDGTILCETCYEERYADCVECVICGEMKPADDMEPWGEYYICPDCLEEKCPTFNEIENEKETTEAYESMKKRYIGRKVSNFEDVSCELEYDLDDPCVKYTMSVEMDEEGTITDISRLSAELLLSEWDTGSDWRPYPIERDDYEDLVDSIFEENDYEFE